MNEDTKLECLRLAIEWTHDKPVLDTAKQFYEWVTSEDKSPSLQIKYEKTLKGRD